MGPARLHANYVEVVGSRESRRRGSFILPPCGSILWPHGLRSSAQAHGRIFCGEHYEVLRGRRVLGQIQLSMGHRRRGGLGCWHSSITRGECLPTATRLPEKLP